MPETNHNPAETPPVKTTRPALVGRRSIGFIVASLVLAILFFLGLRYLVFAFTHESTDDAFIDTAIIAISSKVAGIVSAVHVRDNQRVNIDDPLMDIDPKDYDTALTRRRAALSVNENNRKSIEAGYELMTAKVASAEADARQSESEAAASKATADKAAADLRRAELLFEQKVISPEEYDQFQTEAAAAKANAEADRAKVASDQSKVQEVHAQVNALLAALDMSEAQIAQSKAEVKAAELDVSYTHLVAPTNGAVTRKSVEPGEYVQVGQRLLAVVPTNVWVTANFKETQLENIRPGMTVKVHVDAYPKLQFTGHVDSIQSGSGARFSLLPPENAVGNFVKVVQRVPVKILFDKLPGGSRTLGPGMSVVPSVRTSDFKVPEFVLALLAIVLAPLGALLGLKALPDRSAKDSPPAS